MRKLETATEQAARLAAMGYAITSRKFRHASRVDRHDWIEFCKKNTGTRSVRTWYRRVLSKDTIVVEEAVRQLLPRSSDHRGPGGSLINPCYGCKHQGACERDFRDDNCMEKKDAG